MDVLVIIVAVAICLHIFLKHISSQVDDENFLVRALAHLLGDLGYQTCGTCSSERVMFLPDKKRPCRKLIESLKQNKLSAPLPCYRNGRECVYYHGYRNEESCALAEVLRTLNTAKTSVSVCMYSFTNDTLSDFLKFLKNKRGVKVRILTDRQHSSQENDQIAGLASAGFEVRLGPEASMHNKYCIVDDRVVICGSSNWTHSAFSANGEMLIWIRNGNIVKQICSKFAACYRCGAPIARP